MQKPNAAARASLQSAEALADTILTPRELWRRDRPAREAEALAVLVSLACRFGGVVRVPHEPNPYSCRVFSWDLKGANGGGLTVLFDDTETEKGGSAWRFMRPGFSEVGYGGGAAGWAERHMPERDANSRRYNWNPIDSAREIVRMAEVA